MVDLAKLPLEIDAREYSKERIDNVYKRVLDNTYYFEKRRFMLRITGDTHGHLHTDKTITESFRSLYFDCVDV